jgi:Peroxidase, family 2
LDPSIAKVIVDKAFSDLSKNGVTINLGDLGKHGVIEHDVSLVHTDYSLDKSAEPSQVNQTLVEQLMTFASDGKQITQNDLIRYRAKRLEDSRRENKELSFGMKEKITANAEATLVVLVLGGDKRALTLYEAREFFEFERFPMNYKPPSKKIGFLRMLPVFVSFFRDAPSVNRFMVQKL